MCALGMCAFARLASAKNGCIRVLLAEASCALLGYRHWRKVGLGILGQIYLCACIKYLGYVGMGTQGRSRRIMVPYKTAPGDVRESWLDLMVSLIASPTCD